MGSSCSQGKKSIVKRQQQMSQMLTLSQLNQNKSLSKEELEHNSDFQKFRGNNNRNRPAGAAYGFAKPQGVSAKPRSSVQVVSPQSTASPNTPKLKLISPSCKKISNTEIFILERKRYMMHQGVYAYTPYTILPAPKLRRLEANDLFARRKNSHNLQCTVSDNKSAMVSSSEHRHSVSLNGLDNFPVHHKGFHSHPTLGNFSTCKLDAEPAIALKGDMDFIEIEI